MERTLPADPRLPAGDMPCDPTWEPRPSMEPVPHAQLLSSGLLLEDTEGMGLLDPVDGAAKTAKRGYEEGQEAKTLGEEVDDNYYQKPSTD